MPHILIVDDDQKIRSMLTRYLGAEGFSVSGAADSNKAYDIIEGHKIDLVLMDLSLQGEDGLDITRVIRKASEVPIIILTGKDDPVDKAIGLEVGADDYVVKPFHLRELLARIKSVLKRVPPTQPQPVDIIVATKNVRFADFKVDFSKRQVLTKNKKPLDLTSGEFKLLSAFVSNPHHVMNRDQLLDHVAGRSWTPYDRSIDTQIRRLRLKIEKTPAQPQLIKTVRGEGYIFTGDVQPC